MPPVLISSAVTYSDLELKRDTIRQMFDRARQLREPELMTVCLRRLLAMSEILGDNAAVRHYRTLHLLLQPVLHGRYGENDRQEGRTSRFQNHPPRGTAGDNPPDEYPASSPHREESVPLQPILEAREAGWLPTLHHAVCILNGRFPALTPAETCHFAESRTGILCLVSESFRPAPPTQKTFCQPPLPAIALIFNGCYSGAWRPAFAPADRDFNSLALDTVAIWQINRQSGWSAFLEMTPTNLTRFMEGLPDAPLETSIETSSFSQLLFYRLTDLEAIRAQSGAM